MGHLIKFLAMFFLLSFLTQSLCVSADDGLFQITVIDVGKGDCIIVQTGEHTVMIDTGYENTADNVLAYLNEHGITKLDALIISHFHKDHVAGAAAILDTVPTEIVYMPDYEGTKAVYRNMIAVIDRKGIPAQRLTQAVSFRLGDAEYTIYPSDISFDPEEENDNDVSMTAIVRYRGKTAFFAGDLEEAGIDSFVNYANDHGLDLHCDILKTPHHGRSSDNSSKLLDLIDPIIALITDGSSRRAYGEMIDLLDARNTDYYCSAVDGTYVITAAGTSEYSVQTSDTTEYQTSGPWVYTVSEDGSASITGYTGTEENLIIPETIGGFPVTGIANSAFYHHTELKSVTVPDSVTTIGASAFSWCTGLKNISLSKNITSLGDGSFSFCEKLEAFEIPAGISAIGEYTFFYCKRLAEITIPENVTSIGEKAFAHCNTLEQITIPPTVKSIDEEAFQKCRKLKSAVFESGLKTIKKSMFADCESLEQVTIPSSVKSIKASVFQNCKNLKDIYYEGTEEMWAEMDKTDGWDSGTPDDKTIHFASAPDDPETDPSSDDRPLSFLRTGTVLPAAGITSSVTSSLPKDLKYENTGLTIQLPSVSSSAKIVLVPFTGEEYPITWLGETVGLLEGSALPGKGVSVIVGHNHLNLLETGPFAFLSSLEIGDRIFVGEENMPADIYAVFANEKIGRSDFDALEAISGLKENVLILMTCEDEQTDGSYENRRIIAAEPVNAIPKQE